MFHAESPLRPILPLLFCNKNRIVAPEQIDHSSVIQQTDLLFVFIIFTGFHQNLQFDANMLFLL